MQFLYSVNNYSKLYKMHIYIIHAFSYSFHGFQVVLHDTLYTIQYTVCTVLYSVQCTMYYVQLALTHEGQERHVSCLRDIILIMRVKCFGPARVNPQNLRNIIKKVAKISIIQILMSNFSVKTTVFCYFLQLFIYPTNFARLR